MHLRRLRLRALSRSVGSLRQGLTSRSQMIEVICNDRLGKKIRVKCNPDDTVGDLKKLLAAQIGAPQRAATVLRHGRSGVCVLYLRMRSVRRPPERWDQLSTPARRRRVARRSHHLQGRDPRRSACRSGTPSSRCVPLPTPGESTTHRHSSRESAPRRSHRTTSRWRTTRSTTAWASSCFITDGSVSASVSLCRLALESAGEREQLFAPAAP